MKILFGAYILMAIFHYLYESTIAPSLRDVVRRRMHSIRDRFFYLRGTKLNAEDPAVELIERSICSAVRNLRNFHVVTLWKATRLIKTDLKVAMAIDERSRIMKEATDEEIREMFQSLSKYCFYAALINSGGLLVYLTPFIAASYVFKGLLSEVWNYWRSLISSVLLVPDRGVAVGRIS